MRPGCKLHHVLLTLALVSEMASARAQPASAPEPEAAPSRAPAVPGSVPAMETTPAGATEKPWNRGVPMETREAASDLFDEGYRYLTIPLFARAAEKFQEALALYQHPAIHFNLALAQLNLVQPVEAYESFGRAMAHGPVPIGDEHYGQAEEYRRRLEKQLGHIEIACEQPGAAVTMDGRPLFTGPGRWQGVVVPGEHQVLASADGFIPATQRVVVSAGERTAVTLSLQRPTYLVTERRWPAWRPWAVVGTGALVVAAGAVVDWRAGVLFDRHDDEARRLCQSQAGCAAGDIPAELHRQFERAERVQLASRAIYVVGGVMLTGGAVLVYLNRERPVRHRARAESPSVSVLPLLGPRVTGLSVSVGF